MLGTAGPCPSGALSLRTTVTSAGADRLAAAHHHLERQLGPAAARRARAAGARGRTRRALPAGDQGQERAVPARRARGARLPPPRPARPGRLSRRRDLLEGAARGRDARSTGATRPTAAICGRCCRAASSCTISTSRPAAICPTRSSTRSSATSSRCWRRSPTGSGGSSRPSAGALLLGDLNVAPLADRRLEPPAAAQGGEPHAGRGRGARRRSRRSHRWVDAVRHFVPPPERLYSWWSYRARDWAASDRGRRLDHIWVTPALAPRCSGAAALRAARGWPQPSDHVPVTVELGRPVSGAQPQALAAVPEDRIYSVRARRKKVM